MHQGRKSGPNRDVLDYNISHEDQKTIGGWARGMFSQRYAQLAPVDALVKPAQFADSNTYYIPRADFMPNDFSLLEKSTHPKLAQAIQFVQGFAGMFEAYPFSFATSALEKLTQQNRNAKTRDNIDRPGEDMLDVFVDLFPHMHFQDLPFFWWKFSDHPFFKHTFFIEHATPWKNWCKLVVAHTMYMQKIIETANTTAAHTVISTVKSFRDLAIRRLKAGDFTALLSSCHINLETDDTLNKAREALLQAFDSGHASIANAAGGGGAMRMAPQLAMAAGAGAVAAATEAMATANPGHANAAMHMLPPQAVQMHSFNQIAQQVAQQAAQSAVQQVANMFTQQQLAQHPTQPFPQQFGQPFAQLPVLPFAQQYGQQGAGMGAIGHAGSTLVTHADLLSMQQNLFQNLSQQMTQQMQAHAASTHISMQHLTGVLASGLQAIEMQTVMSSASLGASSSAPTANPNDIVSPSGHGQHRLARHMDRQTALTLAQRKVLAHNSPQQPSSPDPTHPEERNMLLELEAAINPPPTEQAGIPQLAAANVPELQATTMNQLVVLSPNQASQGGRVTMLTVAMIKQRPTVKPVDVELPTTVTFNSSWDIPNSVGAGKSQRWDSWHGYQLQSMTMADVLDDWSVGVKVSPRRPEHAEPPAADHGNSHRIAPLCFLELAHPAIAAAWRTGQVRKVVMMIKALVYAVHMRVFGLPFSITDMPKPPMPLLDAANDVMTLDGKTMTLSRLANKGLKHQWTPINYEKYLAEQGLLKTLLMPTNTWGP
eukprot:363030-Chlamydomonas_euryale.AAC.1